MTFVCPACRGELRRESQAWHCDACGRTYPVEHDIADFAEGTYYDHFDGRAESLTEEHRAGLACGELGTRWRIAEYYGRALRLPVEAFFRVLELPLLRRIAPWLTPYVVVEVSAI